MDAAPSIQSTWKGQPLGGDWCCECSTNLGRTEIRLDHVAIQICRHTARVSPVLGHTALLQTRGGPTLTHDHASPYRRLLKAPEWVPSYDLPSASKRWRNGLRFGGGQI